MWFDRLQQSCATFLVCFFGNQKVKFFAQTRSKFICWTNATQYDLGSLVILYFVLGRLFKKS